MNIHRSLFGIACRTLALSFLMAGTAVLAHAQAAPSVASTIKAPLMLAAESTSASSSSSSLDAAAADDSYNLGSAALASSQPPPRRRYGRPNYASGNSNADGSEKYTFLAGMGYVGPIGITHKYETPSYGYQFGGGRNFNKVYGLLAQFDYDHFGLQGATINNWAYLYSISPIVGGCTPAEFYAGYCVTGQDGNNHVWSFTLNPTFTLPTEGSLGAYAVIGGGFYHKVTNFTVPQLQESCYYYCEEYEANANLDHYTSNAIGVSGGFGLTYKFSHFSNERFYMEARYVFIPNSQNYGLTVADSTSAPYGTPSAPGSLYTGTNIYPQNSNRTTYIPVKFGIRF
jgi:hypothetical protein